VALSLCWSLRAAAAQAAEPLLVPGEKLTFDRAVTIALANHPLRKRAEAEAGAAEQRTDQARSALLPQVSGVAQYLRATDNGIGDTSYLPGVGINRAPTTGRHVDQLSDTFDNYVAGISAFQYLFDFGRTNGFIDERSAEADAENARLDLVQLDLVYGVAQAFYDLLAAKQIVRVYESAVKKRTEHLHEADVKAKAGLRPDIDTVTAEAELERAQVQLVDARSETAKAKAQLDYAMGLGDAAPDYTQVETVPAVPSPDVLDHYLATAMQHRPDLAALLDEARAAGAEIRQYASDYLPRFGAVAGFNTRGQDESPANNFYAGIVVTWSIFNGFLTDHQVEEAKLQQQAATHAIEDLRQRIVVQVKRAYLDLVAGVDRVRKAEKARDAARLQLDLAEGRYTNGLGSIIELSDAERQLTQADADLVRAKSDLALAKAAVDRATGVGMPGASS
jgi:outer membrane protein TolC